MSSEQRYWAQVMLAPTITINIHPDDVIPAASKVLGISEAEIAGTIQDREHVDARTVCAAYFVLVLKKTLQYAGDRLGKRHHTTILNNINTHKALLTCNRDYREKYDVFVKELEGGLLV